MSQGQLPGILPPPLDPSLSQFYTPPDLADMAAKVACITHSTMVLEPCAGAGALVRAAKERGGYVTAVEIAENRAPELLRSGAHKVYLENYLTLELRTLFDMAFVNPPYEGSGIPDFIEKSLRDARRVTAIVPTRALHGQERFARIWDNVWIGEIVYCVKRPAFTGSGGQDEIVVVRMMPKKGHAQPPCNVWHWLG